MVRRTLTLNRGCKPRRDDKLVEERNKLDRCGSGLERTRRLLIVSFSEHKDAYRLLHIGHGQFV